MPLLLPKTMVLKGIVLYSRALLLLLLLSRVGSAVAAGANRRLPEKDWFVEGASSFAAPQQHPRFLQDDIRVSFVRDINPGPASSHVSVVNALMPANGRLPYFFADDGVHGREPWVSDGTFEGTRLLLDIAVGNKSSNINSVVDDFFVYHDDDYTYFQVHGLGDPYNSGDGKQQTIEELWRTNGNITERLLSVNEINIAWQFFQGRVWLIVRFALGDPPRLVSLALDGSAEQRIIDLGVNQTSLPRSMFHHAPTNQLFVTLDDEEGNNGGEAIWRTFDGSTFDLFFVPRRARPDRRCDEIVFYPLLASTFADDYVVFLCSDPFDRDAWVVPVRSKDPLCRCGDYCLRRTSRLSCSNWKPIILF